MAGTGNHEMKKPTEAGRYGEELAASHLCSKGYRILERNWHDRHREIDIVAIKGDRLVFVEVKTRRSDSPELPFESITRRKQHLLVQAAHAYIEKTGIDLKARFDVISVICHPDRNEIDHIEDAIYPDILS